MAVTSGSVTIGSIDAAGLSERELVDTIRELEDLKAQACAAQARLTRELDRKVRERQATQGVPAKKRGADVPGFVAYARREAPARAAKLLGFAHALSELPQTQTALTDGVLSEWRAILIARETACLSTEERAVVDAQVCAPDAKGVRPFEGWGDRRLVAEVQKRVARVDAAALVERRSRAESDRSVSMRPSPDVMARLSALLPAGQGVAVWASLSRAADEARAKGDERSRQQVMADTLVERVTGQSSAAAVPVTVNLVVSDETLLGGGSEPAWLQGHGLVSAEAADELARRAIEEGRAALRRLYAPPSEGALVAMDSVAREFPRGLATFLELRDRTCRSAWCDAPIRHHDHVVDHAHGGPTSAVNGQGVCEQCNYVKQAPGWRSRPITGPPGRHTVETTMPTGHVVTTCAPSAPAPAQQGGSRQRSPVVHWSTGIALEWAA